MALTTVNDGGLTSPVYVLATEIDLTSATTITGIPSGTNWVEVMVRDMSTDGTEDMGIQLGTSGGIITSGYVNATSFVAPSTGVEGHTDGFRFTNNTGAAATMQGIIHLRRMSGNTWVMTGQVADTANNQVHFGGGSVSLSGELTQIKIDPDGSTFDNGNANIAFGE
tara:strand:+ start:82 stop:582 length:501 start_codon:yes stop_codon:yes gene_type:complete